MSGEILVQNVSTVIDIAKQGLTLFGEFPLNIMVTAGIVGIGIALVKGFIPRKRPN